MKLYKFPANARLIICHVFLCPSFEFLTHESTHGKNSPMQNNPSSGPPQIPNRLSVICKTVGPNSDVSIAKPIVNNPRHNANKYTVKTHGKQDNQNPSVE